MEWISVEDRLPEHGVEVICWWGGHVIQGYLVRELLDRNWWENDYGDDRCTDRVTHWMPLERPKRK